MRKFIKIAILFSLPIITLIVSFELLLRKIPNDYTYKRNYLTEKSKNIEVLFLGSSHIYFGINPEYMKLKSFNGAHISQSLNFDLMILEKYGGNLSNLKYIIIPIDYSRLFTSLEYVVEKWRIKNYCIYYELCPKFNYLNSLEVFNLKLPDNISRVKSYLFNGQSDISCNKFGYGIFYNSKNNQDLIESGRIAAKRHSIDNLLNSAFFENIQSLLSIIEYSKKKNVKVIFITCPAYYTYRENIKSNQLNFTLNIIKEFTTRYPNTYYYNFFADKTFVTKHYFDADHLNEIGAEKLTLKMDSIINNLEDYE